jgi:hypothetical protein
MSVSARFAPRTRLLALLLASVGTLTALHRPAFAQETQPDLPRESVDTIYSPPSTGNTIIVPAGGDFQAALESAQPGDIIQLEAGAEFRGTFFLRNKTTGTNWIYIRSSAHASLPSPGSRVSRAHAPLMPKLLPPASSPLARVITTEAGAHHYRFVGIEIASEHSTKGVYHENLITIEAEGGQSQPGQVPHHIVFDRCYIHGTPDGDVRRGIAMNGKAIAVIESYLSDFHIVGQDTQAIMGWNGPGPFKIVNNYLEGAGENIMFGGADLRNFAHITDLVPSDIEIRRNTFGKPLSWCPPGSCPGDSSFAGTEWTVKNLFELKNARRVLIDGNVFENNWAQAQNGTAILFTVRNQSDDPDEPTGIAPWSAVQDITFTNNIVRHTARGVNIHGYHVVDADGDGQLEDTSLQTRRILIKNNLFYDVSAQDWGDTCDNCAGWLQIADGTADVIVDHNTVDHANHIIWAPGGRVNTGFVYRNNIAPHNASGIIGTETSPGNMTLDTYFAAVDTNPPPDNPRNLPTVRRNVIAGPWPSASGATAGSYSDYCSGPPPEPPYCPQGVDNYFPDCLDPAHPDGTTGCDKVGFTDYPGEGETTEPNDYRLAPDSRYRDAGTDGKDIGADIDAILEAINGSPPVAPAGLVVHLKFDEGGTETEAKDSSGSSNHGELLNGPAWVAGKAGNALAFDGIDDLVRVENSPTWNAGYSQYTAAFWVKVNTVGAGNHYKVALGVGDWNTPSPLKIYPDTNGGWTYVINTVDETTGDPVPSGYHCGNSEPTPPRGYLSDLDGTFHHVAVVLDAPAGRCYLYSDGELIYTDEFVTGKMALGALPLYIGGLGDVNRLRSDIDDVRLYTRALSAAEINELVAAGGPPPTSTAAVHLKFDDETGTTATDSSANENDGRLLNGAAWVTGKIGGALSFDGVDDLVEVPYSSTWSGGFTQYTVAFWVKVNTTGAASDYKVALGVGDWHTPSPLRVLRDPSGGWNYFIQTTTGQTELGWYCHGTTLPLGYLLAADGVFHHVAVVFDEAASRCDLYSDGQLIHTDEYVDGPMALGVNPLYIGGLRDVNRLHSDIDDVRFYTRALSATEILELLTGGGP